MSNKIDKLQRVELRKVWPTEERGFTRWLSENMDILSDALKIDLTAIEVEKSLPDSKFSADLIAQDGDGKRFIIENQFGKSDHDHLGKTITYLTGLDAAAAIWISPDPRPEHIKAINWLNESSPADFYMVKLEAVRIGESSPAFLLTLIVGSSPEVKQAGQAKKELSETEERYKSWWTSLIARPKNDSLANLKPSKFSWMGYNAGKPGLTFNYIVNKRKCAVELYIDKGAGSKEENKKIFNQFFSKKEDIEKVFGGELEWDSKEGRQSFRICYTQEGIDLASSQEKWPEIQDKIIGKMNKMKEALQPHINSLRI